MVKGEAENTLSLKILIDKQYKKVLFAEAGKDFVDFLFHIMTLPVGAVVRLLKANCMTYYRFGVEITGGKGIYHTCCPNFADFTTATCPKCHRDMIREAILLEEQQVKAGNTKSSGYVKEVLTYMVMDDLEVKPMLTLSSITVLNQFNVKDVGALEHKEIVVGMNEAVELLKTSLSSKNVLTDVFFSNSDAHS
ncbi:hypothetical protein MLD38_011185 [Melastoma candidum]|uniref:Uncharacterized protein n=1 Tax=Melastoma candidum TaxID=119954 RepID=A0ACB9R2A3_9MYRT|nr:hypothetical protein MLD38_011185 [Melastoma candidum]